MAKADPTGAFNAADFRTAIRGVMTMGAPNAVNEQVTFLFAEKATYAAEGPGPAQDPYDWSATPTTDIAARTVMVPVAVEYAVGAVTAEGMGEFDFTRATLTLLDEDYAQVEGASQVLIGGNTFTIDPPGGVPFGLFDVTVYQIHCSALT